MVKGAGMEGRAATEELDRMLDAVLPTVVRDSAASEGGRLYRTVMGRVEMPLLRLALELSAGNQLRAARLLGINRNTLRKRLRLLGLLPAAHTSAHGAKTE
jgi:two-component system nitrogen regulation response regulator GlnG